MSIEIINLRKLLQLLMAGGNRQISLIRRDINDDLRKSRGPSAGGGDFFVPFWAAAKSHVRGDVSLNVSINRLIAAHGGRKRLYPLLADGFLSWWTEKRRWRNDPFTILDENVKCQLKIEDLNLTVKIENLISVQMLDNSFRLVYPYFSEDPPISNRGARIGIYLLSKALKQFSVDDFRILDVLRSRTYAPSDITLTGNEQQEFYDAYMSLRELRRRLLSS